MQQELQDILDSPHTTLLSIPPRLQWENHNGYCGQTAVQSIALSRGGYISQEIVRKIAGSELLIGDNAAEPIRKLGFEIEEWDSEQPQPQSKAYLQWIKEHILKGHPVIVVGYDPEGNKQEYDHIYLAMGVNSTKDGYNDDDILIYADFFSEEYTCTEFGKVTDDRSMSGNGKNLKFAIPVKLNYGIAFLGINNSEDQFLPIEVELERNSEPNVTTG